MPRDGMHCSWRPIWWPTAKPMSALVAGLEFGQVEGVGYDPDAASDQRSVDFVGVAVQDPVAVIATFGRTSAGSLSDEHSHRVRRSGRLVDLQTAWGNHLDRAKRINQDGELERYHRSSPPHPVP
jgi:hypothetical protein